MLEPMLFKKNVAGASLTTFSPSFKDSTCTILNNNLRANCGVSGGGAYLTTSRTTGKYYAEFTIVQFEGSNSYSPMIGMASNTTPYKSAWVADTNELFWYNGGTGPQFIYRANQRFSYGSGPAAGDVIGMAMDIDNKIIQFYRNGTGLGAIAYGTNNYSSSTIFRPGVSSPNGQTGNATICDFNQTPIYLPSGYLAW